MGVEIKMSFNTSAFQLDSVAIGSFLGSNPLQFINKIDNTAGNVQLAYTVNPGGSALTAAGTFATMNFKVKTNAPAGTSTLDLTTAILSDPDGAAIQGVSMNDANIEIVKTGQGISPTPATQTPTANATATFQPKETKIEPTTTTPIAKTPPEATSAPRTPGFDAPLTLAGVLISLIICNLVRKNR